MWLRLALVCSLGLVACGEERPVHRPAPPSSAPPTTTVEPEAPAPRDVTFTTSDGVTIAATLARGARVDAPAVVLVHQVSSTRAEWAPLIARLHADASLTTLAIDMRGHGESTHGPNGTTLDWGQFDDAAWAATRLDVLAALAFLVGPESGASPPSFAVIGSSIGSSAVIAAAAEDVRLATIVTISPGRAYHGFDAITPAASLGDRAILAVASRDEEDSVQTAETYGRITSTPPVIVEGDAHGVLILASQPSALDHVEDFVRERLQWVRVNARPAAVARPPLTSTGVPAPTH